MAKYEKKFSPKKANAAAAALFDYLADGTPRNREDVINAITTAIPATTDNAATQPQKQQRSIATNTIYVARRTGRIIESNGTIALEPTIAAQWREFRGATTTPTVEATAPAVETTVEVAATIEIDPLVIAEPTYAYTGV